jgi:hypothetical protein
LHAPLWVDFCEHLYVFAVEAFAVCAELACAIVAGPVELYVAYLVK